MKITVELEQIVKLLDSLQQAEQASLEITKLNNQLYLKLNQVWQQAYRLAWPEEQG